MKIKNILSVSLIVIVSLLSTPAQINNSFQIQQSITIPDTCNHSLNAVNEKPENPLRWIDITIPIIVVILGGFLAIYQVKMNIIKSARITWIENLRDTLSQYISATSNVEQILDLMRADVNSGTDPDASFKNHSKSLISSSNESMRYATKVKLYLNIKEDKHKALADKIDEFIDNCVNTFDKRGDERTKAKNAIKSNIQSIVRLAQYILKNEWDRVSKSWIKRKLTHKNNA
ncbi:MAG: hypothetical protein IT276_01770 [Ignavibacteriaceae bacterium]|nr:hypothetical protein [Ignavibacteriaceae bacterium]HRP92575.1 hypothetical protein [Ignavibacteriaceae bacterium]